MSKLIVFAAPSGAGKTTIVRHLLETFDDLCFSVSATTRQQRPHEREGRDYYFLTPDAFRRHIEHDDFVEWEEVYSNQYYGTLKSEIERLWKAGKHILFDIDVVGALNIKKAYPRETLTVFVKPPSMDILRQRLHARDTEDDASVKKRLEKADWEMTFENKFDQVLVNDVLEDAFASARHLVRNFIYATH